MDTIEETIASALRAMAAEASAADRYRRAFAAALLAADEKSAERRTAQADLASAEERLEWEFAKADARASRWLVEASLKGL